MSVEMADDGGPSGFEAVRAAKAAGGKNDSECVQVVVRCRPMNKTEKENKCAHIVDVDTSLNQITIKNPQGGPKSFTFDGTFDETTQQRPFYDDACFTLVESILVGFNATIFAYGQTGCGKSFSMQGPPSPPEMRGVIPNAFAHLFEYVKSTEGIEFLVRCSYLEIYNEEVKDLLDTKSNKKCDIRENPKKGVFVNNLSEVVVDTAAKIQSVLERGLEGRTVAATNMNAESSRSHSIFTIVVEMSSIEPDTGREILRAGKLNLVDLAGSERQKKTGASGDTLKQGAMINLSLTSLGNVIQALTEAREHIPYRDSKLTRLLQDSLGGNTKTLMIAAVSPADYNFDETMSTLRYANRAKNIKNKPKINEDPKDTLLRTYKEEIERLKKQLEEFKNGTSGGAMDMGAINNMMAMLNGDAMNSDMITHTEDNGDTDEPDEVAKRTGGSDSGGMNFAAFAGGGSSKASPRGELAPIGEGSPGGAKRLSPRLNKDRTPERMKQQSSGPSSSEKIKQDEHYQMLAVEHEYVHGQLKERDEEIELEKQRVAEMASKLLELEGQLMSNMHAHSFFGEAGGAAPGASQRLAQESAVEMAEREAAKKAYEERKAALKAKRDLKKVKARNEKQEHEREKEFLLDSLREQSRNLQEETQERMLYEQIVHSILSAKDLKKVLDRCRWHEEQHCWVLPAMKQRAAADTFALPDINKPSNGADDYSPRAGNGSSGGGGYGVSASIDNSSMFSSGKPGGSRGGTGNRNNFTISPRIGDQMQLQLPNGSQHAPYSSVPPLESQTPRSRINSGRKVKDKSQGDHGGGLLPSSLAPNVAYGSGAGVAGSGGGGGGDSDYEYPVSLPASNKPPKAKNKGKKRKSKKNPAGGDNAAGNGGDDQEYSDWGFNGNGVPQQGGDEPAYSDDEDFDEDENGFQNHDPTGDDGPSPGDAPLSFSQFAQCQPISDVDAGGGGGGGGGGKKKNKKIREDPGSVASPGVSPRAPQLFPSLK